MWVGGVVEYISGSWYWWCFQTEGHGCSLCSGVHVRISVLVIEGHCIVVENMDGLANCRAEEGTKPLS